SSQTARIPSAATAQRLYDAILALPLATPNNAYLNGTPTYQLVFHTADQEIPSTIDMQYNLVSLNGNLQSRTGSYTMNDQFKLVKIGSTGQQYQGDQEFWNLVHQAAGKS